MVDSDTVLGFLDGRRGSMKLPRLASVSDSVLLLDPSAVCRFLQALASSDASILVLSSCASKVFTAEGGGVILGDLGA